MRFVEIHGATAFILAALCCIELRGIWIGSEFCWSCYSQIRGAWSLETAASIRSVFSQYVAIRSLSKSCCRREIQAIA